MNWERVEDNWKDFPKALLRETTAPGIPAFHIESF
jgi:hypothetical protein